MMFFVFHGNTIILFQSTRDYQGKYHDHNHISSLITMVYIILWLTSCGNQASNLLVTSLSLHQVCVIYPCMQRKRNNITEFYINKLFVSVCTSASCWDCGREVCYDEFASSFFYHTRTCFPSLFLQMKPTHRQQYILWPPLSLPPTSGPHCSLSSSFSITVRSR